LRASVAALFPWTQSAALGLEALAPVGFTSIE
jgi:hypothetical protein